MSVGTLQRSNAFIYESNISDPISFENLRMLQNLGAWVDLVENKNTNADRFIAVTQIPPLTATIHQSMNFIRQRGELNLGTRLQNSFKFFSILEYKKLISWMEDQIFPTCNYTGNFDAEMRLPIENHSTSIYFLFVILKNSIQIKGLLSDEELSPQFISLSRNMDILLQRNLIYL